MWMIFWKTWRPHWLRCNVLDNTIKISDELTIQGRIGERHSKTAGTWNHFVWTISTSTEPGQLEQDVFIFNCDKFLNGFISTCHLFCLFKRRRHCWYGLSYS